MAYVYIITNKPKGTLYIGVTNSVQRRFFEHSNTRNLGSFSDKYHLNKLVYFEQTQSISDAIAREKQLKNWNRAWKIELIEKMNPEWLDLMKN